MGHFDQDQVELVAGAVYGYRMWSLVLGSGTLRHVPPGFSKEKDLPGRPLTGAYGYPWVPQVNIADCAYKTGSCTRHPEVLVTTGATGVMAAPRKVPLGPVVIPSKTCSCGFWAYWTTDNCQYTDFDVCGVVKGYGRVRGGPYGFRCEKAEIVALCYPSPVFLVYTRGQPETQNISALLGCGVVKVTDLRSTIAGTRAKALDVAGRVMMMQRTRSRLSGIYGCPVYGDLDEMLRNHPLTSEYKKQKEEQDAATAKILGSYASGGIVTSSGSGGMTVLSPPSGSGTIYTSSSANTLSWGYVNPNNLVTGGGSGGCGGSSAGNSGAGGAGSVSAGDG